MIYQPSNQGHVLRLTSILDGWDLKQQSKSTVLPAEPRMWREVLMWASNAWHLQSRQADGSPSIPRKIFRAEAMDVELQNSDLMPCGYQTFASLENEPMIKLINIDNP